MKTNYEKRKKQRILLSVFLTAAVLITNVNITAVAQQISVSENDVKNEADETENENRDSGELQNESDNSGGDIIIVDSGQCGDNLTWKLDSKGTLTISGSGEMWDYNLEMDCSSDGEWCRDSSNAPWNKYADSLQTLIIENGVTTIGDHAFLHCSGFMGSLEIPDSVILIGIGAFQFCSGFTGNLEMPSGITTIRKDAFWGCSGFTGNLKIPSEVTSIESGVFWGCSGFTGNLEIPSGVTSIESGAFLGCSGFTGNLEIPSGVTSIESSAFVGCSGFTGDLKIPSGITRIAESTFSGCSGFTGNLEIPSEVTDIGMQAFLGCSGFTGNLVIPDKLAVIESGVFGDCSGFSGIVFIPPSVTEIDSYPFGRIHTIYGEEGSYAQTYAQENNITFKAYDFSNPGKAGLNEPSANYPSGSGLPEGTQIVLTCAEEGAQIYYTLDGTVPVPADSILYQEPITLLADTTITAIAVKEGYKYSPVATFIYHELSGQCGDNLTWKGDRDGTLTISGSGEMWDYSWYSDSPWRDYTDKLQTLIIEEGVTSIGDYAFYGCHGFTGNLELPSSVASIGERAFAYCRGFTGELEIPLNVTSIGDDAFSECSGFTGELEIPLNITSIGDGAFSGCSGFTGNLVIPSGVTSIGDGAFSGCSGFTGNLVIPSGVTSIGDGAFSGCSGFTGNLVIPSSVTSIGECAFSDCSGFTGNLVIPSSVTSIEAYAFNGCNGFTEELELPSSVTSIGEWAFNDCSGFTGNLVIPSGVTSIGAYAFNGCNGFTGKLELPSSIISIGDSAFNGCSGFTGELKIPTGVTDIGESTFNGCSGFTGELKIPTGVTGIGEAAFFGCSGFTGNLEIPSGVISIGWHAFSGCDGLGGIAFIPPSVIEIRGAFGDLYNIYGEHISSICTIYGETDSYAQTYAQECGFTFVPYNFSEPENTSAASGQCGDNLTWKWDGKGTLTISGKGRMWDYCDGYNCDDDCNKEISPWHRYAHIMQNLIIENGVTTIGAYAFSGCSGVTGELKIPDSVTFIGLRAFQNCRGFTGRLVIPSGVTAVEAAAFNGCSGFTGDLVIPSGVTSIGWEAFGVCLGLSGITFIPPSVTEIGWDEDKGCFIHTIYGETDSYAQTYAQERGITFIPYNFTEQENTCAASGQCGDNLMWEWDGKGTLTISGNGRMWDYCDGYYCGDDCNTEISPWRKYAYMLKTLIVENGVTAIGAYAFSGCSGITGEVKLPDSVTFIGARAFRNCRSFTGSLVIPSGVTNIAEGAFWNCTGLSGIAYIPPSVTEIGAAALRTIHTIYGETGSYAQTYACDNDEYERKFIPYDFSNPEKAELDAPSANYPSGSKLPVGTQIVLTCVAEGAKIYYTLDGTVPTPADGILYQEPISLAGLEDTTTVMAVAVKEGCKDSPVAVYTYHATKPEPIICTVTFQSNGGTWTDSQQVEQNAVAVKPQNPVREGYRFTGWYLGNDLYDFNLPVTADICLEAGWEELDTLASPVSSHPSGSELPEGTQIVLTCAEEGAEIYYTLDGTIPTPAEAILYREPVTLHENVTVTAVAVKEGYKNSLAAMFIYTVITKQQLGDLIPEDLPEGGIGNVPEGIWLAGISDKAYTGADIKQTFRVYHGTRLLKEQNDYTVVGKNSKAAYIYTDEDYAAFEQNLLASGKKEKTGTFDPAKAPQVTIKMKGNYSGSRTVYYRITPADITGLGFTAENITQTYIGRKQTPVPQLTWDGKTLKFRTDYTIPEYEHAKKDKNAFTEPGIYTLTITGRGSFTGELPVTLTISRKDGQTSMSQVTVKGTKKMPWTGERLTPGGYTLRCKNRILKEDIDYTVSWGENTDAGIGTVTFTGTGTDEDGDGRSYIGTKTVTFKIVGTPISRAVVSGVEKTYSYTGGEITPEPVLLYRTDKSEEPVQLKKGTHYTIRYEKNKEKGTAALILTGLESGGYTGTKKVSFKIAAARIDSSTQEGSSAGQIKVIFKDAEGIRDGIYTAPYMKGGAKPEILVTCGDKILESGRDYTVSYINNKKTALSTDTKAPAVIVKGKGNYVGRKTESFSIAVKPLTNENGIVIEAGDKTESKKPGGYRQKFKIYDADGKPLGNADYDSKNVTYTLIGTTDKEGILRTENIVLDKTSIVPAGSVIRISVQGKGNYAGGTAEGTYRILSAGCDIGKATIRIQNQTYTGKPILITEQSQFMTGKVFLKINGESRELILGENIEAIPGSYVKNINKGTAKVTFRGIGNFGGTKTVSFKIVTYSADNGLRSRD